MAAIAFTWVTLSGCFALALTLTDGNPADPILWLGLPRRAAIIMYGVGLLPMLVLPLAYALNFERDTLDPADWDRIRNAADWDRIRNAATAQRPDTPA